MQVHPWFGLNQNDTFNDNSEELIQLIILPLGHSRGTLHLTCRVSFISTRGTLMVTRGH